MDVLRAIQLYIVLPGAQNTVPTHNC